jgi:hypothetical protein
MQIAATEAEYEADYYDYDRDEAAGGVYASPEPQEEAEELEEPELSEEEEEEPQLDAHGGEPDY